MTKDTEIYYGGDMANDAGFGTITAVDRSKWGTSYKIQMQDGREMNIPASNFSHKYLGHGGTRFVTREAYFVWQSEMITTLTQHLEKRATA